MKRTLAALVTCAALVASMASPASAASSTAGDATPNFTESSSCGVYGMRGPLSPSTRLGDRIYGPFADYFGRSFGQVSASIVNWVEPSGHLFRVHNRVLGAYQNAAQRINASTASHYDVRTGAAWVWRNIGGSTQMSHHALGNAADVNPPQNPMTSGTLITDMPPAYREAWTAAGFCWGGSWRFSKDAMHYSWRGPAGVAGMMTRAAPYPPLTPAASFTTKALDAATPVGLGANTMSGKRRDGADDLYGVVASNGSWQVQVAGAGARFGVVGLRWTSGAPADGMVLLADADGDGRADLWRFGTGGTNFTADVYYDRSRFRDVGKTVTTGAARSSDAELGLALFDKADWVPDLFVFRKDTGRVEVYSSASGYQQMVHSSTLAVPIGSSQIVLADRNVDGNTDIMLVGSGARAPADVVLWSGGYGGAPQRLTTGMSVPTGSVVLPGDYDGDGRVDLYVLSGGRVSVWLGGAPDRPVANLGDWFTTPGPNTFDAGPVCVGECDQIGYVDEGGRWRLAHQVAWGMSESSFFYGNPADTPFMGDWDCDGIDTPGLYRRSDGFAYLRNSNSQGVADTRFFFGNPSDIPIPGDFDGDGCDTLSLYRPSEQRFYVINELGSGDAGLGFAEHSFVFGDPGDKPFVGDFDANGVDEVGLHRESTGRVYFRFSLTSGIADRDFIYGDPGDFLVAGDWDGDGTDTPAIFRPSTGNWYLRLANTAGFANHVIGFGLSNRDLFPVVGRNGFAEGLSPQAGETLPGDVDFIPSESE